MREQGAAFPSSQNSSQHCNTNSITQALAKNEDNHKALYRKAKALAEQGFFDKSKKVFEELKKKNPKGD